MVDADDDATTIRMLDAVDGLLRSRRRLEKQLAEGWMEMARARYAMGHGRISESLFSLRPHSPLAAIRGEKPYASGNREGEVPGLELELGSKDSSSSVETRTKSLDDSDEESLSKEVPIKMLNDRRLDPLSCFGGLVSPHLRASQRCFQTALVTLVQVANEQRTALQARSQIRKQQSAADNQTEDQLSLASEVNDEQSDFASA